MQTHNPSIEHKNGNVDGAYHLRGEAGQYFQGEDILALSDDINSTWSDIIPQNIAREERGRKYIQEQRLDKELEGDDRSIQRALERIVELGSLASLEHLDQISKVITERSENRDLLYHGLRALQHASSKENSVLEKLARTYGELLDSNDPLQRFLVLSSMGSFRYYSEDLNRGTMRSLHSDLPEERLITLAVISQAFSQRCNDSVIHSRVREILDDESEPINVRKMALQALVSSESSRESLDSLIDFLLLEKDPEDLSNEFDPLVKQIDRKLRDDFEVSQLENLFSKTLLFAMAATDKHSFADIGEDIVLSMNQGGFQLGIICDRLVQESLQEKQYSPMVRSRLLQTFDQIARFDLEGASYKEKNLNALLYLASGGPEDVRAAACEALFISALEDERIRNLARDILDTGCFPPAKGHAEIYLS